MDEPSTVYGGTWPSLSLEPQDVEMQQPSVPIHSEAVHGALDPDGPGKENCGQSDIDGQDPYSGWLKHYEQLCNEIGYTL